MEISSEISDSRSESTPVRQAKEGCCMSLYLVCPFLLDLPTQLLDRTGDLKAATTTTQKLATSSLCWL